MFCQTVSVRLLVRQFVFEITKTGGVLPAVALRDLLRYLETGYGKGGIIIQVFDIFKNATLIEQFPGIESDVPRISGQDFFGGGYIGSLSQFLAEFPKGFLNLNIYQQPVSLLCGCLLAVSCPDCRLCCIQIYQIFPAELLPFGWQLIEGFPHLITSAT